MFDRRSLSHGVALLLSVAPGVSLAQGQPAADLRVLSIDAPPELFRGMMTPGSVWITNDGTADANGFLVDVYVGSPAILLGQVGPFSVPAGMRIRPAIDIDVPPMTALGASTLFVIVDSTSVVTESRETNNAASVPVTILDPLPNLVPRLDPALINAELGQLAAIPFSVVNDGVADAPATSLAIYVSADPRITTSDRRIDVVPIPPLAPGQTHGATANATIPVDLAPGVYWVGAIADAAATATELDENDNVALGGNLELFVPELRIATVELPVGTVGAPYLAQLVAVGGSVPPTWSIVAGRLPSGLSLDPATGVIAGVPTEAATITLLVEATSGPAIASTSIDLQILPGEATLTIHGAPLPRGLVGVEYAADLWVTGGAAPYAFSASSLPPGLRLTSDGALVGTPTRAGRFTLDVLVVDAAMHVARASLALEIDASVPELPRSRRSPSTRPSTAERARRPSSERPAACLRTRGRSSTARSPTG
ncbi:putative Ig domain-containing protein [Myxococcota bacterium]|nr:putative Ig domain-containing protein [Myxococcota bacterium]